jgi:hypothetical protein
MASGSSARVVEAAEALVKAQLEEVIAQPRWAQFADEFPREAVRLMTAVAVQLSDDRCAGEDGASRRPRLG